MLKFSKSLVFLLFSSAIFNGANAGLFDDFIALSRPGSEEVTPQLIGMSATIQTDPTENPRYDFKEVSFEFLVKPSPLINQIQKYIEAEDESEKSKMATLHYEHSSGLGNDAGEEAKLVLENLSRPSYSTTKSAVLCRLLNMLIGYTRNAPTETITIIIPVLRKDIEEYRDNPVLRASLKELLDSWNSFLGSGKPKAKNIQIKCLKISQGATNEREEEEPEVGYVIDDDPFMQVTSNEGEQSTEEYTGHARPGFEAPPLE